jgi:hypothetical protein
MTSARKMGGYWRPKWGLGMKVEAKAEVGPELRPLKSQEKFIFQMVSA